MYDEDIEDYEAVLERDVDNDLAYYCLGLRHGLKKEYAKSLTYYNDYLERRKEDNNAQAERGLVLYELGEKARGQKMVEKALKVEPDNTMIQKLKDLLV